jgi:6-hydroxymethylpterin diphosphokinase MptE-like
MSETREKIKSFIPRPVLAILKETRDGLKRAGQWPAATLHPWRRESIQRLAALKDTRRGERCFVIGNGPSLKNTDMSLLRNENTIGMNRIYLMFPELGFQTSYLVTVNDLVIEQCAEDLQKLDMPRFVSWRSRKWLHPDPKLHFLHTTYTGEKFAKNVTRRLWEGATVTYVSLQLAYHLGFEEVILIGVDHSFASKGKPNTTVVSQGDDPNHFSPGYFGKGFRWQLPDLDTSEIGYQRARLAFETDGRRIVDATVGGKLQVFPKADYLSLFGQD